MEIREINVEQKFDCEHMLGKFLTEDDADVLIENEAVNIYGPKYMGQTENDETNLICALRPKVFTQAEIDEAYEGLANGATESTNRGQSAGNDASGIQHRRREIIDAEDVAIVKWLIGSTNTLEQHTKEIIESQWELFRKQAEAGLRISKQTNNRGVTWQRKVMDIHGYENHLGKEMLRDVLEKECYGKTNKEISKIMSDFSKRYISETETAFPVLSGIGGYYGRYPRIPYCRTTLYTADNIERWEKCINYIERVDHFFKEILPTRYGNQKRVIDGIDPKLRIRDTAFTTITINNNFRTACHRDAGDLKEGFGNLSCTGKGEWDGGYTILPEYRVGAKLNPGDVLLMDVHQIHGNTPIREKGTGREAVFRGNKNNVDHSVDFERISLVCYLRENMSQCGSREYEDLRKQFVTDLMNDESRPEHKKYENHTQKWNGVFADMWESDEWVHYLRSNGFDHEANQIRPQINTIDSLFS